MYYISDSIKNVKMVRVIIRHYKTQLLCQNQLMQFKSDEDLNNCSLCNVTPETIYLCWIDDLLNHVAQLTTT